MQPLQLFAVGISLSHASLLAGIYFSSSIHSSAFVSTEIDSLVWFRVALTFIVLVEASLCAAYIYTFHRDSEAKTSTAAAFVVAAIAGWGLLTSYPTNTAVHMAGAIAFIAATAAYSLFFISKSEAWRPWLYAMWGASIAAAFSFAALYFAKLYEAAAALEWAAFTLDAITLCLFFAVNPPKEEKEGPAQASVEYALPLLHPSAYS
jgi:hypothetical protein